MALMERVATLIRANINDLLDKAEDPEKLLKQVIVDMQNQLLQVKTQVAIAIADQHLLLKKQQEHKDNAEKWMKKAELAVNKKEDDLARAAIERSMTSRAMADSFAQQGEDQRVQVENLKSALQKLTRKLEESFGVGRYLHADDLKRDGVVGVAKHCQAELVLVGQVGV